MINANSTIKKVSSVNYVFVIKALAPVLTKAKRSTLRISQPTALTLLWGTHCLEPLGIGARLCSTVSI